MSNVIIPKPGKVYNENFAQGSDGNYYVKNNDDWAKIESDDAFNKIVELEISSRNHPIITERVNFILIKTANEGAGFTLPTLKDIKQPNCLSIKIRNLSGESITANGNDGDLIEGEESIIILPNRSINVVGFTHEIGNPGNWYIF